MAVALLAILAVLSWRGLDAVIQSRERLVTESDELRSLTLALAQLEEDLLGTWPVKNLGGGIRPIRVVQDQGGAGGAARARNGARRLRAKYRDTQYSTNWLVLQYKV